MDASLRERLRLAGHREVSVSPPMVMRSAVSDDGDRLQVALMLVLLAACSLNVMFLCARL